jgi:hypothetical protein
MCRMYRMNTATVGVGSTHQPCQHTASADDGCPDGAPGGENLTRLENAEQIRRNTCSRWLPSIRRDFGFAHVAACHTSASCLGERFHLDGRPVPLLDLGSSHDGRPPRPRSRHRPGRRGVRFVCVTCPARVCLHGGSAKAIDVAPHRKPIARLAASHAGLSSCTAAIFTLGPGPILQR